jgi:hypothetical protein
MEEREKGRKGERCLNDVDRNTLTGAAAAFLFFGWVYPCCVFTLGIGRGLTEQKINIKNKEAEGRQK